MQLWIDSEAFLDLFRSISEHICKKSHVQATMYYAIYGRGGGQENMLKADPEFVMEHVYMLYDDKLWICL
jgi:hypothetical protein